MYNLSNEFINFLPHNKRVKEVWKFIVYYHNNQKYSFSNGEYPYFTHCKFVAGRLFDYLGTSVTLEQLELLICVALLHDVVEDTNCTIEEIKDKFGEEVATLVNLLTNKHITYKVYLEILSYNREASLIKCCDLLENLYNSLSSFDRTNVKRINKYTNAFTKLNNIWNFF